MKPASPCELCLRTAANLSCLPHKHRSSGRAHCQLICPFVDRVYSMFSTPPWEVAAYVSRCLTTKLSSIEHAPSVQHGAHVHTSRAHDGTSPDAKATPRHMCDRLHAIGALSSAQTYDCVIAMAAAFAVSNYSNGNELLSAYKSCASQIEPRHHSPPVCTSLHPCEHTASRHPAGSPRHAVRMLALKRCMWHVIRNSRVPSQDRFHGGVRRGEFRRERRPRGFLNQLRHG